MPAAYEKACAALTSCASIDECQTWANKAAALASYARQADDDTLQKQTMRIQGRAVRRCGELLTELKAQGTRTDRPQLPDATVPKFAADIHQLPVGDLPKSATAAARAAGMSDRQRITAVRVAKVSPAHFEATLGPVLRGPETVVHGSAYV